TPTTIAGRFLAVFEAGLGFAFLGTVVGYLPTMYNAFAQREIEISLMDARAGSPPVAVEFLRRTDPPGEGPLCDEMLAAWERWAAQLLETHISYPQLSFYRSQHSNQSWLATLVTMLDATSLILARSGSGSATQAQLTFAMARHALVDITQIFVPHYTPGAPERLAPGDMATLRTLLGAGDTGDDFETRLGELRLSYEPYAQALAAYLLLELPLWVCSKPRHDNWQGGPWDRQIHSRQEAMHRRDDHF
ncbi:MAG: Ion transport 2 domain-containing protein, partial [bacterium]